MKVIESVSSLTARIEILEDHQSYDNVWVYFVRVTPIISKAFPDMSHCQTINFEVKSFNDAERLFRELVKATYIFGSGE